MDIPAKYDPSVTEDKWYAYWLENNFFHSEPNEKEPYSIVIPPPNVTGVLHMGHMLNNTIQDVLVRRARMMGKNACWVPGTDHASIATEAKVVAKLKERGIEKTSITREQFLDEAWKWKEEHGGIILEQLKKLGASCDWDRTRFTMDEDMSRAVIDVFVYFYKKGLIYRGVRMVNWDPQGHTAVSDEEVIHRETKSKLYYLKYFMSENGVKSDKYIIIATTRPETIMADAAVCVNPDDERYRYLRGKHIQIPLIDREIPVIEDSYVTMDFGTGCLKVTPAHDENDYAIGLRHNLPVMDIIDDNGKLNEKARILVGEDRFVARKKIVKMLEEQGYMEKEEDYLSQVGYSERTNAVIEPRLSMQWFLKMDEMAKRALDCVESGDIKIIPDKYTNTYRHWMETVRDWCISRQLWWGQRIPAYYLPDGKFVVEADAESALAAARKIDSSLKKEDLKQDPDVLDTWFSSWLWPMSVFDPSKPGFPEKSPNADLQYYYPTNDLVTAPEILFFWVARMVMAGTEFTGKIPFRNVYLTGIVRDKLGRKMSKSLGNSPDPIKLMGKYGADGVRMGMLLCSSAGNDILFDESQVEQGRNFSNKIWNAFRLVKSWEISAEAVQSVSQKTAVVWFGNLLNRTIEEINDDFSKYRLSESLMTVYRLFRDDFCGWYLELVKPEYGEKMDISTFSSTTDFLDKLLKILHPYMPFITEEIWQNMEKRSKGETIMLQRMPEAGSYSEKILNSFDAAEQVVNNIRNIRQSKGIAMKKPLELFVKKPYGTEADSVIIKLGNISGIKQYDSFDNNIDGVGFMVGTTSFFLPLGNLINIDEEIVKIRSDIEYLQKFLKGVENKLSNRKFIEKAPEKVVELERKKKSDAETKLKNLNNRLCVLSKD
ncbi:MAG: valine--tRNA ligase [Bacteroidales bacterium]|jgi:valyl-tRNA synthetase|nr:valine--tRNA ligase [Bacteroidales bacterium]